MQKTGRETRPRVNTLTLQWSRLTMHWNGATARLLQRRAPRSVARLILQRIREYMIKRQRPALEWSTTAHWRERLRCVQRELVGVRCTGARRKRRRALRLRSCFRASRINGRKRQQHTMQSE